MPGAAELDAWVRQGYRTVELASEPVVLSAELPGNTAEFLRFLRDAAGSGINVAWRGRIDLAAPTEVFGHLAPPGLAGSVGPAESGQLFLWRQGPGFVQVTDRRTGSGEQVMTFGDESLLRAFRMIQQPLDTSGAPLDKRDQRAIGFLCEQGIGLRIGPVTLALPCRIRRWPVPAFS